MTFLLNLLIALLCGVLVDYIATRLGMDSKLAAIVGLLVGVIVFLASPAHHL